MGMGIAETLETLESYFEKTANHVRYVFGRAEEDYARPFFSWVTAMFIEDPISTTFISIFAALCIFLAVSFVTSLLFDKHKQPAITMSDIYTQPINAYGSVQTLPHTQIDEITSSTQVPSLRHHRWPARKYHFDSETNAAIPRSSERHVDIGSDNQRRVPRSGRLLSPTPGPSVVNPESNRKNVKDVSDMLRALYATDEEIIALTANMLLKTVNNTVVFKRIFEAYLVPCGHTPEGCETLSNYLHFFITGTQGPTSSR
ncbi:hypothetical protein OF83DRAFT_1176841 [Amylostereum chailletii]|nr:hypothetical protein OF83DRAFT_1176841 [Amylostereum chailletii]